MKKTTIFPVVRSVVVRHSSVPLAVILEKKYPAIMKKTYATIMIMFLCLTCYSQECNKDSDFMWLRPQKENIKTLRKFDNGKLRLLQEFNNSGKCYFVKNDGLNGDVIAIWDIEFDEKGREIKTICAHSNVGFNIYETEYFQDTIKQYTYTVDTIETIENITSDSSVIAQDFKFNPYKFLKKIKSKSELENLQNIKDIYKQKRYLERISILNGLGKPTKEYYFNHKGDTTAYSIYTYTTQPNKDEFHYKKDRVTYDFTNFSFFDNQKRLIQTYRVFYSESNRTDTTEFKVNTYNSKNKIESTSTFEKGVKKYLIIYEYENDRLILEKHTNYDRPNETRCFIYFYNVKGELIQEKAFDKDMNKKISIYKYKTKYKYC